MRSRSTLRVIVAAVAIPLLVACVAYYYFLALMGGLLTVPTLYAARIAAGDGGHLTIRGVGETGFRAKGSDWNVRYASAGGERTEDVGAWFGRQPEFVAGQAAGRLVFAALPDRLFVRTARGAWKEFSLRSVEMWESEGIHVGGVTKLRAALALGRTSRCPPAGWSTSRPTPRRSWWTWGCPGSSPRGASTSTCRATGSVWSSCASRRRRHRRPRGPVTGGAGN